MPDGAVRVVLWPEQRTLLPELVTVATGFAFTTTDCATLVAVQPSLVVPVTV